MCVQHEPNFKALRVMAIFAHISDVNATGSFKTYTEFILLFDIIDSKSTFLTLFYCNTSPSL